MKNLTETDLEFALSEVIKPKDDVVWIASAIWTFGPRFAAPTNEIGPRILNTLLNFLGKHQTLIISSYTSAFSKTQIYDLIKSKPETGILPNLALKHSSFQRSHNPINNYLVTGPRSKDILSKANQVFWSDTGFMGWVEKNNIRICMIGVPWHEGCSLYHRAEEKFKVPYRYYKCFKGTLMKDNETIGPCEETLLVYPKNIPPIYNWNQIRPLLPKFGEILTSTNPIIFAESTLAKPIINATESILRNNTFGLLQNNAEIEKWVDTNKANEINQLEKDQQSPFNDVRK